MSYDTPNMDQSWLKDVPFTSPYQNQAVDPALQQSTTQSLYVAPPSNVVTFSSQYENNENEMSLKNVNT